MYTRQNDMRGQNMNIIDVDIKHKDVIKIFGEPHKVGQASNSYSEIYEWRYELFNGIKFSIEMSNSNYAFAKKLKKVPSIDKTNMITIKGEIDTINMLEEYFNIMIGENGDTKLIMNYIFEKNKRF